MQSTHGCQRLVQKKLEAVQSSVQEQQRRAQGLQAQIGRFAARQREEHNANAAKFRQVRVRPWALHQRPAASAQCAHPSLHCSTLCLADRAAGSLCSCVRMKTIAQINNTCLHCCLCCLRTSSSMGPCQCACP